MTPGRPRKLNLFNGRSGLFWLHFPLCCYGMLSMLNRACALFVVALLALALFGPEQAFTAERCTVLDAASADARQRINDHLCLDRKSTRLNSSHVRISYAVFCLKKKKYYLSMN